MRDPFLEVKKTPTTFGVRICRRCNNNSRESRKSEDDYEQVYGIRIHDWANSKL